MLAQAERLTGAIPRPKADGAIQYFIGMQVKRAFAVTSFDLVAHRIKHRAPKARVNAFDPQRTVGQVVGVIESVSSERIVNDQQIAVNVVGRGCAILLNRWERVVWVGRFGPV